MKALFSFRTTLLLAALLALLTACSTPETPPASTPETTAPADAVDLIAADPKAVEALLDTDHPVLIRLPQDAGTALSEGAQALAAHVGATVLTQEAGYACQDLPEQKLRLLRIDLRTLDQAQTDRLTSDLASTPEGFGVVLLYPGSAGDIPHMLTDIADAFLAGGHLVCAYADIAVDADFTKLAKGTEFLAHITDSDVPAAWLPGTACRQLVLGAPAGEDTVHGCILNRRKNNIRILGFGTGLDESFDHSMAFEATELPFSTEYLTRLETGPWAGTEDGLGFAPEKPLALPYEAVTLLVKVNAPFEVEILSGYSADSLMPIPGRFSNKEEGLYACAIPQEHTHCSLRLIGAEAAPVNALDLELADVQLWYDPCDHHWQTQEIPATCIQWGVSRAVCDICGREDTGTVVTDITDRFVFTQNMTVNIVNGKISADDKWALSEPVDVSGYDSLEFALSNDNSTATASGLCFFNAEGRRVAGGVLNADGTGQYGVSIRTVEIPETAVYVRTIWFSDSNTGYDSSWGSFWCKATGPKGAVPPTGHSYDAVVTPPGCKSYGYTTYTCSVCGDSYEDNKLPMEHHYVGGVCTLCGNSVLGIDWIAPDFPEGDYAFAVLPDTQSLVEHWPERFENMMQWLADNKDRLNLEAVLHLGDMVDDNLDLQWKNVKAGMNRLDAAGLPWMPMRGNHDSSEYFNRYFDWETYGTNRSWFGGTFEEGTLDYTYWFVNAGSREYLILSLGWAPTWEVLDWAKAVVEAHPTKNVIITAHGLMNTNGQFLSEVSSISITKYFKDRPEGYQVWEAFAGYPNVVLTMGGHVPSPDIITRTDKNGAGKDVTSLLLDRQHDDVTDRLGTIAFLIFHEDSDTVDICWYSHRFDAFFREKNRFSFEVPHVSE